MAHLLQMSHSATITHRVCLNLWLGQQRKIETKRPQNNRKKNGLEWFLLPAHTAVATIKFQMQTSVRMKSTTVTAVFYIFSCSAPCWFIPLHLYEQKPMHHSLSHLHRCDVISPYVSVIMTQPIWVPACNSHMSFLRLLFLQHPRPCVSQTR